MKKQNATNWKIRSDKESLELIDSLPHTKSFPNPVFAIGIHNPFSLFRPMSWLSTIIRRIRNSPINHMGVVFYSVKSNKVVFAEADQKGVHATDLQLKVEKWKKTKSTLVLFELRPGKAVSNEFVSGTYDEIEHTKYGVFQLFNFWLATIRQHPVRSKKLREGKVYVCSTAMMKLLGSNQFWVYSPKEIWDSSLFIKKKLILK